MKTKFCPGCGDETNELIEGLCVDCYRERRGFTHLPDRITLERCKNCGRIKKSGRWRERTVEEEAHETIQDKMDVKGEIEQIKFQDIQDSGDVLETGLNIKGKVDQKEWKDSKKVNVEVKDTVCKRCSKATSGYFEAVVQLRGDENKLDEALGMAGDIIENDDDDMGFVSDIEDVKNGYNLYLGSNSTAKKIAKRISSNMNVERKNSKTLEGMSEGKKRYRSTYLLRMKD